MTYVHIIFRASAALLRIFLPAQQLWIGEDLLQSAVVADAKGEDGLSRVACKMPGYARREGQHHLPCDLHNTSGAEGEKRQNSDIMLNKNIHSKNLLSSKSCSAKFMGSYQKCIRFISLLKESIQFFPLLNFENHNFPSTLLSRYDTSSSPFYS